MDSWIPGNYLQNFRCTSICFFLKRETIAVCIQLTSVCDHNKIGNFYMRWRDKPEKSEHILDFLRINCILKKMKKILSQKVRKTFVGDSRIFHKINWIYSRKCLEIRKIQEYCIIHSFRELLPALTCVFIVNSLLFCPLFL